MSKVMRMSIVASGDWDADTEGWSRVGAKTWARREAILAPSQTAAMESGKSGESRMKTSEVERRPRTRALSRSSFLRMGPRESAFPVADLLALRRGCGESAWK